MVYLFIILFSLSFELFIDHYSIEEFFYYVNKIEISEENSNKLIDDLIKIFERYVFLDIIKNPPQPKNKENYYNKVNIIEELNLLKKGKRPFFEFYRDLRTIIDKCQDRHLFLYINENFEDFSFLHNSLLISPIILYIKNKKVYSLINNNYPSNLIEDITLFENKPIKSINGIPPFEYIQNFNDRFLKYKSPQAQFVSNLIDINNPFSLVYLPLDIKNLTNITIIYDDNTSIKFDYRIEFRSNLAIYVNYFLYKFEHFFMKILICLILNGI